MGQGTERERSPGVWELRVHVGTDPITGRRVDRSRTVRNVGVRARRDAMRKLLDEADEIRAAWATPPAADTDHTVAQLLEDWWWLRAGTWSPKTAYDYAHTAGAELLAETRGNLGGQLVEALRTHDIDRTYLRMAAAGTKPSMLAKAHRILRAALTQAVTWEWIARNPAVGATLPVAHTPAVRAVDLAPIMALIESIDDDPDMTVAVRLALIAGQRRASTTGLRWCDIDWDAGELTFAQRVIVTPGPTVHVLPGSKTGRTVRLAVGERTIAILKEYYRLRRELALAAGVGRLADTSFVLARDAAGTDPWRPDTLTKRWRRLADAHGLEGVRLQDLRHTMVTYMLGDGVDVATVAGRAGHANKATTLNVYSHALPANDRVAAEQWENTVDGG